jgi:predicted enzyme related to lactoylglutathione lyase
MTLSARYVHTNIIACDWRRLAKFYEEVLGCVPVPPERHLAEPWLEEATHLPGAELRGMHLRLPGHGVTGPTLEVFEYQEMPERQATAVNRPGLAHLAFAVEDVPAAQAAVLAAGGRAVGQVVTAEIAQAGRITFAYVTDPEGNVIELQRWDRS